MKRAMADENTTKRQFYTGDNRQLARRVQECVDSFSQGCYIDPVAVADNLQRNYREYTRRKRLAFRKSVQRVCDWVAKQKTKQTSLDRVEHRHLNKRRKQDKVNREDNITADSWKSDDDHSSFSSDIDDYKESKDTNMVNDALSRLYSKGTPSAASSPGHALKSFTPSYSGTPDTTPGRQDNRHRDVDSDGESVELCNLSMDMPDDVEAVEPPRRRTEMMLPRIPMKETTPAPSGSSTPQTSKKRSDKKRKSSNQTLTEEESTMKKGGAGAEKGRKAKKKSKAFVSTLTEEESTMKKGGAGAEKGRKAKKKIVEPRMSTVTFSDIGGNDETLDDVCELLMHMRHPEMYRELGGTPPRGVLLHGPPGCGKTLLAHAIAGELKLPFLEITSTKIVSGVSGESEGNIRDLFEEALGLAPCILFLDEIDAITPKRETAQREMERRIVAQLLSCMDDLGASPQHVLVIGATNRADSLDPALRRAGRFDEEIFLGIPDERERERILQVLFRNLKLSPDFSFASLSSLTPGYVGADLVSLCRKAIICAVKREIQSLQRVPTDNQLEAPQPTDSLPSLQAPDADENSQNAITQDVVSARATSPGPTQIERRTWLKEGPLLTDDQVQALYIMMQDFEGALPKVQPSAKREGFATIPDVTWDDIGALHAIRDELTMAIVVPVKIPAAFKASGLSNPPGILLVGPPGCGKTLLAKAIANEVGVNFISVKGPELMNKYVGESERAVRQCFHRARNAAPCVIFFDELDSLCPKRSDSAESGSSTRVVAQLLAEMDGFDSRKQVFIVGATNRPDIIDPAMLRPGRLDKTLYVGIPSPDDRVAILKTITKNGSRPPLANDVNLDDIGKDHRCDNFTGADLAALVREAFMAALREVLQTVPSSSWQRVFSPERGTFNKQIVVAADNFQSAFKKVKASVSKKERKRYKKMPSSALELTTEEPKTSAESIPDITWDDIGALHSIKEELTRAILVPVRNPAAFKALGLSNPPGILLAGPPGCGKTLLAKAIANESGINFISVKGPELMNKYVGESERAVRQYFHRVRNSAPCVIFFEQLDALCPKRSDSAESGSSARVVIQLLTKINGLESRKQVFIIGATNRPDIIDPAVLRLGCFGKTLYVGIPSPDDRVAILKTITKNGTSPPLANDVNLDDIGKDHRCDDFTGADLATLVREASMAALQTVPSDSGQRGDSAERGTFNKQIVVVAEQFQSAFMRVKASVSKKERERYKKMRSNALELTTEEPKTSAERREIEFQKYLPLP